ncbi:MAG: short-chain dehydrogenase [Solirubrobacterales bacterium 70-9]|nr:MAG: short-chain dehydrogenase [Solirubrobacterales bacterium 70-9]
MERAATVIIGGTAGLGRDLAELCLERGHRVVIAGRDEERCAGVAAELHPECESFALDLSRPAEIGAALAGIDSVRHIALVAIERDENTVADYSIEDAIRLTTLKLVGYTEVVHQLAPRMSGEGSVVLYGGQAQARPYPGSTTVSTVNGGVIGMVRTMAVELAPIRVNAIHPGVIGDSPYWADKPEGVLDPIADRTPIGRLVTMRELSEAALFLLENGAVNGINLAADGGWTLK